MDDSQSSHVTQTYTYVCHPSRFNGLGLNMEYFGYCNKSLPFEVRAKDLVDRLSLTEKVGQLGDQANGVPRIGLPKYYWWSEALHGVSDFGDTATFFNATIPGATSFPTPISMVSSFNVTLWKTIGQVVSTEARAMNNLGQAGLTYWSPNMNVVRDPRWGRALETPGEDPFVVGTYASTYVRGLQDVEGTENTTDLNSRPLKVAACCKHYAAYDVDNWFGLKREGIDVSVREQDMLETFVKPFEMCINDGDVSSVMCSYNRINGIPACADRRLLLDTIRKEWNLHGYIVSDCDSIEVMYKNHKWLNDTPEAAVAQALKAGLDLDCGAYYTKYGGNAVVQGKVREADVDKALKNLYVVLMRVGFFDGSPQFESLGKADICSEGHRNLAIEAARQGMVLLKNDDAVLPLNGQDIKSIALVGPHANVTTTMIGNYHGIPCGYTSPLDAFKQSIGNVLYAIDCADVACDNGSSFSPAIQAARDADATVIVAGLDLTVEAEQLDREDLLLPGNQTQFINQVASASKGPVVLVIISAGGVDISFAKANPNIKAILWTGYPGEQGGHGIADVILGKYNPGGRLPLTWYEKDYVDLIPMTSLQLRPLDSLYYPGRTYKFFNGSTVYPFGYGLSYTTFGLSLTAPNIAFDIPLNKFQKCRDLNYTEGASKPSCPGVLIDDLGHQCDSLTVGFDVEVANVGEKDGSEVVFVYWSPPRSIVDAPIKQIIAFSKVFVAAGESTSTHFAFNVCKSLELVDYKGYKLLASGVHKIIVGSNDGSFQVPINFQT
ncbi:beta-xylosidase/alpha-L-arabinofuranosidase 2-like [Coffea arabica]|uniref:Beta-xylosidase/alpha-L-arabinofuranosidase 2-like n=1 Tax=Coffea arabica TaxID=13443 RepID=A0ABM4VWY5_COFAR